MRFSLSSIVGLSTIAVLSCVSSASSLEEKTRATTRDQKEAFNAISIASMTKALGLYGFALDEKNYSALEYVYIKDVVARVAPDPIFGLSALEKFYAQALGSIKTQHITTNIVIYNITATTADAISYSTAFYFGSGKIVPNTTVPLLTAHQTLSFFERFEDKFVKGDDGLWRISERQLTVLAVVGNAAIANP